MNPAFFLLLVPAVLAGPRGNFRGQFLTSAAKARDVCLTPGCVKAAATILELMDPQVDPCNDFYEFACGTFAKETVIPDHKTYEGSFSIVRDKLNERLRKLFEADTKPDEPKIFQSVRKFYSSCMDKDGIEEHGKKALLELVEQLGGWPVVQGETWNKENFTWTQTEVIANRLGYDTGKILSVGISTNPDNSTQRMMEVDQPSLGLKREYLIKGFEDKDVQAYYKFMVDTAVYLGVDRKAAEEELKESLMFELKIAEMTIPRAERRNKTALNNQMTIAEANKMYPSIDFTEFINNILDNPDVTVNSEEVVNVAVPAFVKKLAAYISSVPARVQANYMMWRFIKTSLVFMDEEARDFSLEYTKALTGKETESPRWETCVQATAGIGGNNLYWYEGSLTNAVGAMYAKKYFPESSKNAADQMVTNVKKEFKVMLDELEWMDDSTRERAHIKVDKMTPVIGYAKEILNNKLINEFYSDLELTSSSYINNFMKLKVFINEYYVRQFRQPVDKHSWKTHGGAAVVNAFYSPSENSIQFPAGILDGVFYQSDRPNYMNYGAVGMVVGHEITHGFDDQGSQKDGDGNLVNWWEPETKAKYLEKARCIIEQYGNFTVDVVGEKLNVSGVNTQGENIADNGGYKEALRAYARLVEEQGEELSLPGLNYSPRQMFWLSGASVWCTSMREETLKNRVLTDPHSPARFRVNGPLRNLPEFSQDWGCPKGAPMNPDKKCSVW
jgi:membrane metallo-endopeptidase-like protein 1